MKQWTICYHLLMSFRLPHTNWVIAHVLEALGVVGLFIAFDYIQVRCVEPGFYIFLFALWFALLLCEKIRCIDFKLTLETVRLTASLCSW